MPAWKKFERKGLRIDRATAALYVISRPRRRATASQNSIQRNSWHADMRLYGPQRLFSRTLQPLALRTNVTSPVLGG